MELSKAKVVVTGASRGLGAVLAESLAERGADLLLVARSQAGLETVRAGVAKYGTRVFTLAADLGERGACEQVVAHAQRELGSIDVLVNNAGLECMGFYEDLGVAEIEQVVALNLTAPMVLTNLVLADMVARDRGHVLNIASIAGLAPFAFGETYGSTKHGIVGFTRALRASLKERGSAVSASVLCPGFVSDTGLYAEVRDKYGVTPPRRLGHCTSAQVVEGALRCVERDLPDLIVNNTAFRDIAALGVAFPRLAERVARRLRVNAPAHRLAKRRREEREREGAGTSDAAPAPTTPLASRTSRRNERMPEDAAQRLSDSSR